jgi:hypothetical protein
VLVFSLLPRKIGIFPLDPNVVTDIYLMISDVKSKVMQENISPTQSSSSQEWVTAVSSSTTDKEKHGQSFQNNETGR